MPVTDSTSAPELPFVVETLNLRDAHDFTPLDTALRAMHAQSIDRSRFEIIVVVDPSAEPELAGHLEANWPDVRVLEVPPGTHYYAMKNAGAVAARGAVVGYVDADCQPAPSWAESMCEALLRSDAPPSFAVGAYDTPRSLESWLARAFLVTIFANQIGRAARQTNSIAASNSAVLRERIVAEPFRDDPFFHGPDVEMATRILGRGEQIVLVPGARNIHDHEPGLASQHGRGVYWGYCFLRLRLEGSPEVKYAKLFRRLGPLAPLAVVPAKALIDVRHLLERRRDLEAGAGATLAVAGLLVLNALSVSLGAMRYYAGLPPPRQPQNTRFSGTRRATDPTDLTD